MSQVRQISLLTAGCQPWNIDVCAACADRFAYCATLAIYVYQLDRSFNEFRLSNIVSEHTKTITALCWSATDSDLLASASADREVVLWSMAQQAVVSRLQKLREIPICLGWSEPTVLSFTSSGGPLMLWNYSSDAGALTHHKDAHNFSSPICQFRWHEKCFGKLVFGHKDGSISLFKPGSRCEKHVLRDEDAAEDDAVMGLAWDPLSTDYLLLARAQRGVALIDTQSLTTIQNFTLPSAASQVHTIAWVPSAPGMFITGGTQTSSSSNTCTQSCTGFNDVLKTRRNIMYVLTYKHDPRCYYDVNM